MSNRKEQVQQYSARELFKPGDLCECRELGRCEVLEVLPAGMLRLRTAERCDVLARAFTCQKVRL